MYDIHEGLRQLRKDLSTTLNQHESNGTYASLLTDVELGIELLSFLGLEDEPITVLWVLLSDTPIRHPKLQGLTAQQRRAKANARIMLPGYLGRFGWESALRDYIRYIPSHLRCYHFETDELDQQIVHACRTQHTFTNRTQVYQACLTEQLSIQPRKFEYAKAGIEYRFKGRLEGEPENLLPVTLPEDQVAAKNMPIARFDRQPRPRMPITISWQQLEAVANFIVDREGNSSWRQRLDNIDFRLTNQLETRATNLELDGMTHIAGVVSSGKSTLINMVAASLVYEHRIVHQGKSPFLRIALVVGDSSSSVHLADQFNRWFCNDPDRDAPVAVPLLGRSTRDRHLRQLYESREYGKAMEEGRVHWGERFLNPVCPLQGFIPLQALHKPLIPGTEPCNSLFENNESGKDRRATKSYACPLFVVCPSQQVYRDMVGAQIWITTPGAMGQATLPSQLDSRRMKLGDVIYEQCDLVVFDEVDTVVEWFDRQYAQSVKLTGDGEGLLDELDPKTSAYWSKDRLLPDQMTRWIEAQRRFITPANHILALLRRHETLRKLVERGYFTSLSLFFRFARRLLGLRAYEYSLEEVERNTQEQQVNSIMPVFENLVGGEDPLMQLPPAGFRMDQQVTATTLQNCRTLLNSLSNNGERSGNDYVEAKRAYDRAFSHAAYQLALLMQQTMNIGDSTKVPVMHQRYRDWIIQFVPDIETRLTALRHTLENSEDEEDKDYLEETGVDTPAALALQLEFAVNAALLDRHIKLVFYEWHNRPADIIEGEQPYRRIPDTLLNILPAPPTGRLFGIYHTSGLESHSALSTFGYTNIGRSYVLNFHNLRTDLDGQHGPNVLAMSGTSYLPDSSCWHFDIPPKGILMPSRKSIEALQNPHCWFRFIPMYDLEGKEVRVSGVSDKRSGIRKMINALVGGKGERGGRLGDELRDLEQLAQQFPHHWADRTRLLLLVNSYEQCEWAGKELRSCWSELADRIYYLVSTTQDGETGEETLFASGQLGRVDIEMFRETEGAILIAPLQAIGRGFNILNANRKAAFGAIYFLTRPMPHPHDIPAIAQEINRRTKDWFDDPEFCAWQLGDGVHDRGVELRRRSGEYWRRVEARKYYWQLRDEKDQPGWQTRNGRLHANPRRDLAATTAGKVVQAVGRLLRGDVPFHAYFVDAAWAPQQAKRIRGLDVPFDTPKTSLLAAMVDVLADYVGDPVGRELYQALLAKLENIEHFDWTPIE